jgi:hypothetical protein
MDFPIMTDSQVAVLKADGRTGQVLTADNERYLGDNKPTYLVFETIDLARKHLKEMGPIYAGIEFSIFDKDQQLAAYIPAHEWAEEKVSIPIRVTPAICFPLHRRYLHLLSDFSYGEWLIFENNKPKYYLNIFDDIYKDIRRFLEANRDVTVDLMVKNSRGNTYQHISLGQNYRVITMLESQSELVTFELEKVPPGFLISGFVNDFFEFMNNHSSQE